MKEKINFKKTAPEDEEKECLENLERADIIMIIGNWLPSFGKILMRCILKCKQI